MMATVFTNRPSIGCSQTPPPGINYRSPVPKVIVFNTLQDWPRSLDFVVSPDDVAG
jgi:hypothetical protein